MNENVNYYLKKDYSNDFGVLKEGSEFRFVRGACYYNGGMVPEVYARELRRLIDNPDLKSEYIKELPIIYNKV